jgi:uncharacterized damage-inducible protein DinB
MGARYAVVADPDGNSVGLMGPIDPDRARIPTPPAQEAPAPAAVEDLDDPRRREPNFVLPKRQMLEAWLEFHRTTLLLKCEALDDARRKTRPIPSSKLSLHGLIRHMAEVERSWFRRVLLEETVDPIWYDPAVPDSELVPLDDADWDADLTTWHSECDASRAAARHGLDDTGARRGQPCSLRWVYIHMIEEYARHNGHADFLRELLDGAVGR